MKVVYCSYFHSVITYGLFLWGHSSASIKIFRLQKRLLESSLVAEVETLVENYFLIKKILPLPSQYILSLLLLKKIGTNLRSILRYIALTLANMLIFTNLPCI
jgi:hypothetical protein